VTCPDKRQNNIDSGIRLAKKKFVIFYKNTD